MSTISSGELNILGVCVFLLLGTCTTESTRGYEIQGGIRQPRSATAFQTGMLAVQKLLKGARYIRMKKGVRKFDKIGNKESAMQEFNSLSPKDVKKVEYNSGFALYGEVGNRHVIIREYGDDISSVIEIIDPVAKEFLKNSNQHGPYGVRVVYKSKLREKH